MCGIVGVLEREGDRTSPEILDAMCRTLEHRGPDDRGVWAEGPVGLAMQRLSIIDLAGGHQPMDHGHCDAGAPDVHIVYNGEIYNHAELRRELEGLGHRFRTRCDTEAILHAWVEWGEAALSRLNGMFAFAIWDGSRRELFLARDRLGIKPLYYRWAEGRLFFGSEIKALLADPRVPREVDAQALFDYVGYEFVPGPRTMFEGIRKLPGGHFLRCRDGEISIERYWDPEFHPLKIDREEAKAECIRLLRKSVERRLMADVPLGVFLSGGVDSSAVVAMVAEITGKPFRTYSIGYDDPTFSELDYAHLVAEQFETEHTDVMIPTMAPEDIERAVYHLDEPMTDLSAMPLLLLCQRAREDVKVCLSGEGGDEVFVGYDRFRASRATVRYYERIPRFLRRGVIEPLVMRLPDQEQKKGPVNVLKRYVEGARLDPAGEHMRWQHFLPPGLVASLFRPDFLSTIDTSAFRPVIERTARCRSKSRLDREVYVDLRMTMQDSVLMKVDKMSMAVSLEVRVPFLDHELVEFATSLPGDWRLDGFETKSILKEALQSHLPRETLYRKKQGYSLPIKNWLRNELRDYARSRIEGCELFADVLDMGTVDRLWREHVSRRHNHNHVLWALLNAALWYDRFVGPAAASRAA